MRGVYLFVKCVNVWSVVVASKRVLLRLPPVSTWNWRGHDDESALQLMLVIKSPILGLLMKFPVHVHGSTCVWWFWPGFARSFCNKSFKVDVKLDRSLVSCMRAIVLRCLGQVTVSQAAPLPVASRQLSSGCLCLSTASGMLFSIGLALAWAFRATSWSSVFVVIQSLCGSILCICLDRLNASVDAVFPAWSCCC